MSAPIAATVSASAAGTAAVAAPTLGVALSSLTTATTMASPSPSPSSPSSLSPSPAPRSRRLILGVCAMDKKTRSKPMTQILDRLRAYGEFDIVLFGEDLILDVSIPVDTWPVCHCLISFTSKGFPLSRVIDYVRLRKPFCVNDLPSQVVLQNRYDIYRMLEKHGIPTPKHLYVDRSNGKGPEVKEFPDHIEIDGVRMEKPLVEKPYDGDDHNIYIYYGASAGGGSRRLFRKVGNRSSRFYPKVNSLRKVGSYIYERLLDHGGSKEEENASVPNTADGAGGLSTSVTAAAAAAAPSIASGSTVSGPTKKRRPADLKVYTIGPGYAHGEMRKCWGTGTRLMMYDGHTKAVEDIIAGDELLGDDGNRRIVQAGTLHSGIAPLFRVELHNAARTPFTCNAAHILVLAIDEPPQMHTTVEGGQNMYVVCEWQVTPSGPHRCPVSVPTSDRSSAESTLIVRRSLWRTLVFEADVASYLSWSESQRASVSMFQPNQTSNFAINKKGDAIAERIKQIMQRDATPEEVTHAAWGLGKWIAEKNTGNKSQEIPAEDYPIPTDEKIETKIPLLAHKESCGAQPLASPRPIAFECDSTMMDRLVYSYGLSKNPLHLPHSLLTDSPVVRESLFGGLIDGAGWCAHDDGGRREYGFATAEPAMAEGIVHLARGIGFTASETVHDKHTPCVAISPLTWTVRIGGDLERAAHWTRTSSKRFETPVDSRRTPATHDSFTITPCATGAYHGFQVDGNGRCLLSDFIVSHNSPVVDGVVARDPDQKELRLLTKLTEEEREMARLICVAFKQNICGFDIIRTAEKSYVIDVNGWSFVKGNLRYYDKCARIMRKMCLNSRIGREALKLDRPLEFIPVPHPLTISAATSPTGVTQTPNAATTPTPVTALNYPNEEAEKEKTRGKEREKDGNGKRDKSTASTDPSSCVVSTSSSSSTILSTLPRLILPDKSDSDVSTADVHPPTPSSATSSSSSASAPPTTANTTAIPPATIAVNFTNFQLDNPNPAMSLLPSLLTSSSNPRGIGVTLQSNTISDCDNNDILLGLVAMFRHADRTPKQKVKLKTKSQTLMQLFTEQMAKDLAAANASASGANAGGAGSNAPSATASTPISSKKVTSIKKNTSAIDLKEMMKGDAGDKEAKSTPSNTAAKDGSLSNRDSSSASGSSGSAAVSEKPVDKEKEKEKKVDFKDLKFKKKTELIRIREAIKVLVVKEQLREKRKKKAAALAAEKAMEQEGGDQQTPNTNESAPPTNPPTNPTGSSTNPGEWSDEEVDGSSGLILTGPDGALDDELLEAAISAEQAKERTKDALKDPEYLSKLFQILSVLEKGYGGVKVQLKPKKIEGGQVVQALLIVKWGGEMTHAGVGQARQYAAAFWDDMIPPPYMAANTNVTTQPQTSQKGGVAIGSVAHPGTTTMLASLANTNADVCEVAMAATNTSGSADATAAALPPVPSQPPVKIPQCDTDRVIQAAMLPESDSSDPTSGSSPTSPPVASPTSPTVDTLAVTDESQSLASPLHGSVHEFAYDHNSSLTQSDRAKLKSQLTQARAGRHTVSTIPEHIAPATPNKKKESSERASEDGNMTSGQDATTSAPIVSNILPVSTLFAPVTSGGSSAAVPPSSTRKQSKVASSLLSLTSAQGGSGGAAGGAIASSLTQSAASGSTPLSGVSAGSTVSVDGSSAVNSDADRLSNFRKQRLAFFQGLRIYSSDEARVVASAEAFYTSTFEHAHGLSELSAEQQRDREEKKKIQSIREWIETSRKTHIAHDKAVQEYLDDTSMCAESMARAKEGVRYILMAENGLTPAQVTRHMLAQEQIARATSEAERADILKEEEELLRSARAEAEAREREEQVEAVSLRQQQLAEEQMEHLVDRLAELEEDGMDLESKVAQIRDGIKAGREDIDCTLQQVPESTETEVVKELEELLEKIASKMRQELMEKLSKKKKGTKKEKADDRDPSASPTSPGESGTVDVLSSAASLLPSASTGSAFDGSNPLVVKSLRAHPSTPPSITPPPSPSSFGPTAMTEWQVRCLRWIGKPRVLLEKLYELLLQLQIQIHSKCEWAEKNTPVVPESAPVTPSTAGASHRTDLAYPADASDAATTSGSGAGRKMSGSGGGLASIGEGQTAAAAGGLTRSSMVSSASTSNLFGKDGSSSSSSSSLKSHPKASTEFEYVDEWEGEAEEEIVGGVKTTKVKRSPAARFGLGHLLCHKETLFLMKSRWDSLIASFYDAKAKTFDPTKIPDLYDCIKYDVLHNLEFLTDIRPLYSAIKRIADFVVPNEYGILRKDKWSIGVGIARPLLQRMIRQLESALSPNCPSRVALYFSSESHIHALRNVLLLSGIACNRTVATSLDAIELNYLSHLVVRLYEDVSKPLDDPLRYYVSVQFSPGAALDPFIFAEEQHTLPVSRPVPVNGRIPFGLFATMFSFSSYDSQPPRRGYKTFTEGGVYQPQLATATSPRR